MEISKAEYSSAAAAASQSHASQELMGSEILVKSLQAEGVKQLWGYPGGAVLYIYDALYKQDTIQHVLVRHEQAAVHAADGFARATGEVGVALVTSGPGLTNAVTGIATAYTDSIPLVVISGQTSTAYIGTDAFQECDTVGITRPIVKHNFLVKDVRELADTMKKAFHIARTGRPGPVVVDIPKDVSFKKALYTGYPEKVEMRSYNPVRKGHAGQIRKALQLLLAAKRPYIYTGGGVLLGNACNELRTLVDMLGYPVTHTLLGLGAYPASDRKFLGMLGMHGTIEANNAMQNCDVLLAVGARFDDRVIGNPKHFMSVERKIIHIDIDPSSISKRVKVDVPIVGDVKEVLVELIAQIKDAQARPDAATLVVGAAGEAGSQALAWPDSSGADNGLPGAGAVYVFTRDGTDTWSESAYLKSPTPQASAWFGNDVSVAASGNIIAIGEPVEPTAGRAHVYVKQGASWVLQATLSSPHPDPVWGFGEFLALSPDGSTLAVGHAYESGSSDGLASAPGLTGSLESGAVYLYRQHGVGGWSSPVYIKAPNNQTGLGFGSMLSLSERGDALAVYGYDYSSATGIGGNQADRSAPWAGAVYLY